jgi:hypothetical protein
MLSSAVRRWPHLGLLLLAAIALPAFTQSPQKTAGPAPEPPAAPTHADLLRGAYGPYRANNDLLYYHLSVRVDPARKFISGSNTIRFRMLQDGSRIQLDLYPDLKVDKILLGPTPLPYTRDDGAVFVNFPAGLRKGRVYTIVFYYEGYPQSTGRFGGITFGKDPAGRPWIVTSCEDDGASIWWPNKDQWRDEVRNMEISVAIPDGLVDVSNGRFVGKTAITFTSTPATGRSRLTTTCCRKTSPGQRHSSRRSPACLTHSLTTSGPTRFPKTATSWSRSPMPVWSTRAPSPTATDSATAT